MVDYAEADSLTSVFFAQAERLGDKPFLWAKRAGEWRPLTWTQAADCVRHLAGGLRALGLATGDRVCLVSENRPEWAVADFAIMAAGGITVPAYTTNTPADHLHILNNSGARFAIVSTRALADKLLAAAWQADRPPTIICMEAPRMAQSTGISVVSWEEAMALGTGHEPDIATTVTATRRDDTACVIYTSGTGGAPKGVMLSHGALLADCLGAFHLLADLGLGDDEGFLCFLPLSHSYEHTVGLMFPMTIGAQIHYAESIDHLAANMAEVRPTIMTAVPRLYESMRSRILRAIHREGGLREKLFLRTVALGSKRYEKGRLGPIDALQDAVLDRAVRDKVRARFGGRLKALVSGGAPLAYEVGLFFTALGVRILQGYGQTEAGPAISCSPPSKVKIDTVGPPLKGIDVRIAEDGEILVRGEVVMQGYWRDEESTRRAIQDGRWLHTGDIGEIDGDGYIRITDRKKDIIVNSGGDNVSPQRVESFLTLQPEIAQAMVHGDRRPHLVALIVPAQDWAEGWAKTHGKTAELAALVEDADFRKAVAEAVERVNGCLSTIEKVRRFVLTAESFNTDNGMLTPTLKIRRHVIRERYGAMLERLYG
ncbi:MAG TPA: long-chain fatty acid--CoA ligase [Candidatus Omnitrophota bacterium]|nr:long-chain fatty acid--CoA ligase [Candidatus Omnitrophota bacterium]